MTSIFKEALPGGVHYGEKLKVYKGKYVKSLGNCSYFNNTYFFVDSNYVSINEFISNKEYYLLMTFYNYQWRIFDYICI